jgi:hypothetical protein
MFKLTMAEEVFVAEWQVKLTISWMASLSLSLCNGLLMPISRCISASDKADMIDPLFTLALHAATYHAGIPTQSSSHATIVGPFQDWNGRPASITSSNISCLILIKEKKFFKNIIIVDLFIFIFLLLFLDFLVRLGFDGQVLALMRAWGCQFTVKTIVRADFLLLLLLPELLHLFSLRKHFVQSVL